jgi:hypothetical protein
MQPELRAHIITVRKVKARFFYLRRKSIVRSEIIGCKAKQSAGTAVICREKTQGGKPLGSRRCDGTPATVTMQSRGFGSEVKSRILKKAFDSGGELQQLLLRFNQALLLQTEQLVAAYRHTIEQQWCRLSADERGPLTKPV